MGRMHGIRSRGFTLIQLMIVVAIIGVLAAVAIPSFLANQLKAKRSEAYANLVSLAKAQNAYFAEFNDFVAAATEPSFTGGLAPTTIARDSTPVGIDLANLGWGA